MTIDKLEGLKGLNEISEQERQMFLLNNADKLKQYSRRPRLHKQAADVLYRNQQFINTFGQEAFDKYNDSTRGSYEVRNALLKEKVINDAISEVYKPRVINGKLDKDSGAGEDWERINDLSIDAKEKLLRSEWKTPSEMQKYNQEESTYGKFIDAVTVPGIVGKIQRFIPDIVNSTYKEARSQFREESNKKILDRIYNDDVDASAHEYGDAISRAYLNQDIVGHSDEETKEKFMDAITPNYKIGKIGVPEFASHYGNGSFDQVSSEMQEFSIDDMRKMLARKAVYESYMSPQKAATALNNEAKRYLKDHQGSLKRFGLFAKDVGIAALSYTADKVNGIGNLVRMAEDQFGDLPTVYVDDKGDVVDPSKYQIVRDNKGNLFYDDAEGTRHTVHQQQISRTTLHNMGKNYDGTEDTSILNPTYWTKAEQFGTLDEDEQKQYEKLGSSPYKVLYDPNDDRDLWYESFKMMSFGLADAASMFIPFGIGVAGRAISTANKAGKIVQGLGKGMDYAGRALSASRAGQVGQGLAGAAGIAYAYERGAFQETLAQNLANAEEAAMNRSKQEIADLYNNDEQYRAQVDALTQARAAEMKQAYLEQAQREGTSIPDEEVLNNRILAQADKAVREELVQQKFNEFKGSDEFAALQNEAIRSAGEAANTTFLPEAVKYGLVNTIGFRKFWYSNPSSLAKGASKTFKGLKEAATETGKQRMTAEASKFATVGQKMKQLSKVAGSQFWGGAWTNGTDDMMVDAAQRINNDSFDRYLRAYESGEGIADTYGYADGIYSYWKGLSNSLGQQTTLEAAAVGGFGSLVSASPNMANIAHLATKEGREAYKNAFNDRIVRNEDGSIMKDGQGNPVTENAGFGERLNFFIQNGVLNNYYAKRQNERDLRAHADYVNKLLDDYDDFRVIGDVITSDMGIDDAETEGDKKTMRFTKAINFLSALNRLGNNTQDPAAMSSVVSHIKDMIDKVNNGELIEEDAQSEISQYYASHPELEQSEANNQVALEHITRNAKKLAEATEAYENAEKQVRKAEKALGRPIAPDVRDKMRMQQALDKHWGERRDTMRDEIGDTSDVNGELSIDNVIPSYGSKANTQTVAKLYDKQEAEYEQQLIEQHKETQKLEEAYKKAQQAYKDAQTSDERYAAQLLMVKAQSEWENAQQEELFTNDMLTKTKSNKKKVNDALEAAKEDKEIKVLTASEIFNLDPTTRARMLSPEMRDLYSEAQQAEIVKLENELRMKDPDSLQKIQDIAKLTNYINQNQDAYNRIMKNPEAAEVQLEKQRKASAEKANDLINKRNAAVLANFTEQMSDALKFRRDVRPEMRENLAYLTLRKYDSKLLNIIKEENLLPDYQKQLDDAMEWRETTDDIDGIIDGMETSPAQKKILKQNLDTIADRVNTKDDILKQLEKIAEDVESPQVKADVEKIFNGLENLSKQRYTTVLESRKDRKQREEAAKKKNEELNKQAEEAAKAAAEKAVTNADKKAANSVVENSDTFVPDAEVDLGEETTEKESEKEKDTVCPVCGKQLKGDYHKHDTVCPQCNSDLSIYHKIAQLSDDEVKEVAQELGILKASMLMEEDAVPGSIDLGEMWQNKEKGLLSAKMEKVGKSDVITLSVNGKPATLTISPDEYSLTKEAEEKMAGTDITKETPFNVKSLEKIDGEWYFEGNFAGHNENVTVKATDKFNIDSAIERQRREREAEAALEGLDTNNPNIIDDGESVSAQSPSLEQQAKEAHIDIPSMDEAAPDPDDANSVGESSIDNSSLTLSGNAMSEYVYDKLKDDGVLERKKGNRKIDSRNHFFEWLDKHGIKLQNIIDEELHQILKANPHAKVKFMCVRTEQGVHKDENIDRHLFLVLDYDNSENADITSIHNEDNGGIIKVKGKEYLIVGTVGYGDTNASDVEKATANKARRDLYNIIYAAAPDKSGRYGLLQQGKKKYFDENPTEEFRVLDNAYTEVVPNTLIPGYVVRQLMTDSHPEKRSISELLEDKARNPQNLKLRDLKWGIQELTQFLPIRESIGNIMVPKNPISNSGSVFLLIPAGNGKMMPAYIEPLVYSEMKQGELSKRVNDILGRLITPGAKNYPVRYAALNELFKIFHLSADGNNILLGKDSKNTVALVKAGEKSPFKTFFLGSDFNPQDFMDAFSVMNPRVNITASVLGDPVLLAQYDEAGAFQTDCALLHTAGSQYSIYPIDANGNMMNTHVAVKVTSAPDSEFRNDNRSQVIFNGLFYYYDNNTKKYTHPTTGETVTDEDTIWKLDTNRRIAAGEIVPSDSSAKYDFYILNAGEHPEVVRVDRNSKDVSKLSEEDAIKLVEKINKKKEAAERTKNADAANKKAVEEADEVDLGTIDPETGDVVISREEQLRQWQNEGLIVTPDTGERIDTLLQEAESQTKKELETPAPKPDDTQKGFYGDASLESSHNPDNTATTQTFISLVKQKKYKNDILVMLKEKWPELGITVKNGKVTGRTATNEELSDFLKNKKVPIDAIGTSEEDIAAWMKLIKECR